MIFFLLSLMTDISFVSAEEKDTPDENTNKPLSKEPGAGVLAGPEEQPLILDNKPANSMKIFKPNPDYECKILYYRPNQDIDYKILRSFSGPVPFNYFTPKTNPWLFKKFKEKKPENNDEQKDQDKKDDPEE